MLQLAETLFVVSDKEKRELDSCRITNYEIKLNQKPVSYMIYRLLSFLYNQLKSNNFKLLVSKTVS
jgi:hypothetical protein